MLVVDLPQLIFSLKYYDSFKDLQSVAVSEFLY